KPPLLLSQRAALAPPHRAARSRRRVHRPLRLLPPAVPGLALAGSRRMAGGPLRPLEPTPQAVLRPGRALPFPAGSLFSPWYRGRPRPDFDGGNMIKLRPWILLAALALAFPSSAALAQDAKPTP